MYCATITTIINQQRNVINPQQQATRQPKTALLYIGRQPPKSYKQQTPSETHTSKPQLKQAKRTHAPLNHNQQENSKHPIRWNPATRKLSKPAEDHQRKHKYKPQHKAFHNASKTITIQGLVKTTHQHQVHHIQRKRLNP